MTAGMPEEPADATNRTNPLDQVADLDLVMSDLGQREEALRREYEQNERLIAETERQVEQAIGTGSAEDGAVQVRADATGRVVEVDLEPRALRLGSIGRLEQAIKTACNAATEAATTKLAGTASDPLKEFFDSMPEVTALLGADSFAAYVEPVLPASPPSPPPPPPRRSERSPYE